MHSNRMRTVLGVGGGVCPGGCLLRRGCQPMGVSSQGCVCLEVSARGVSAQEGGVCRGVSAQGGLCLSG